MLYLQRLSYLTQKARDLENELESITSNEGLGFSPWHDTYVSQLKSALHDCISEIACLEENLPREPVSFCGDKSSSLRGPIHETVDCESLEPEFLSMNLPTLPHLRPVACPMIKESDGRFKKCRGPSRGL